MRTITEFYGRTLKTIADKMSAVTEEATKTATEAMKAEGKSEEEMTAGLPAAIKAAVDAKLGEENKLEGDKLAMLSAALDLVKGARGELKRVIVMAPNEGEKAPPNSREVDGKFYVAEFFPERANTQARAPEGRDARGGRGGRGGKDGKGGGRGGKPGERGNREGGGGRGGERGPRGPGENRAPRGETPHGFIAVDGASPEGTAAGERGQRRERTPRAPAEPYKGPNRIVLKGGALASTTTGENAGASTTATPDAAQ
jgi:hypothetical protein